MIRVIGSFSHGEDQQDSVPRVWAATWNHDGKLVASCGDDKKAKIWIVNGDEKITARCQSTLDDSHERSVRCVNFSNSGRFLASASFDASVVIYERNEDGSEFEEVNKLEGHESEVKCCAFSPSDEFLATCSRDKSVWFWQMDEDDDFNVSSILQPHTQDVKFVRWHPNEELLVSCSYDSSIRFYRYDGEDWVTQQKIDAVSAGTIWCCAFDANGNRLVAVGDDEYIRMFERENVGVKEAAADTWKVVASLKIEKTRWPIYSVSWNHTTGLIATGGGDGKLRIFRVDDTTNTMEMMMEIKAHELDINSVEWNPSRADVLMSAADDGLVKFWNVSI